MMKRKRVAFFLLLVFILTQTCSAFAAASEPTETYVYSDAMSDVYAEKSNSSISTIVVSIPNSFVEFSMRSLKADKDNLLYHMVVSSDIVENISGDYGTPAFWQNLKLYFVQNLDKADVIKIGMSSEEERASSESQVAPYDMSVAVFYPYIKPLHGEPYNGNNARLKYTATKSGVKLTVYQSLNYFCNRQSGLVTLAKGVTLASVAATLFSIVNPSSAVFSGLSALFGLTSSAASTVLTNSETVAKYIVSAQYMNYVTVNGGNAPYNGTAKTYDYIGYENTGKTDITMPYACPDTESIWFSHSSTYFSNYAQQVEDAYKAYTQK